MMYCTPRNLSRNHYRFVFWYLTFAWIIIIIFMIHSQMYSSSRQPRTLSHQPAQRPNSKISWFSSNRNNKPHPLSSSNKPHPLNSRSSSREVRAIGLDEDLGSRRWLMMGKLYIVYLLCSWLIPAIGFFCQCDLQATVYITPNNVSYMYM